MGAITCALRYVLRDDDLRFGVDSDLGIVGLHEAVLALHDPALWIGEVLLGLGVRCRGRRSGFPAAFAPALGFPLRLRSRPLFQLGFGGRLRLRLQFGLGLPDLLRTPLLVGDPIGHFIATLVVTMQLVLFGVRRFGGAEPTGNLGFQVPGALRHTPIAHRLVLGGIGLQLGAIERHMPELDQAGLLAQQQHLLEQVVQRLQVPLAEIRYRAEIRHIEPHNAHEINPLAARLGDPAGGVNAAAVGIQKQRRHHDRIKRRLAKLAAIAASDLAEINFVPHNVQHKASDMALGNEIRHCHRQQQRLINLPRAKYLAHAKGRNLTRPSLTSKIRYYSDRLLEGANYVGVWHDTAEDARKRQEALDVVPFGQYQAMAVSPLASGRLNPPDICLVYATPGQMIILINGLQYTGYKKFEWGVVGETACADSWGRALKTGEPSLSLPCYAERRYGGVPDEEMLMALKPSHLVKAIVGMKALAKNGLRYPIPPYGIQSDVRAGMGVSYTKK